MIVLAWNCRGLARVAAKRALRALIRDIGLLSETKIPIDRVRKFLMSLGFCNLDLLIPKGRKVGL